MPPQTLRVWDPSAALYLLRSYIPLLPYLAVWASAEEGKGMLILTRRAVVESSQHL